MGGQCINEQSQDLACKKQILFPTQLTWQWSMNMIKMLSCRFQQWFRRFSMLLVEGSSKTRLFRHFSEYLFGVHNFEVTKSMTILFFVKMFEIWSILQKCCKNFTKCFCFWDNCIWIGIVNLSLLRTGYFSWAANVLRSSPKNGHSRNRDFYQLNWLGSNQWIW